LQIHFSPDFTGFPPCKALDVIIFGDEISNNPWLDVGWYEVNDQQYKSNYKEIHLTIKID